jgi:hypothetical protein
MARIAGKIRHGSVGVVPAVLAYTRPMLSGIRLRLLGTALVAALGVLVAVPAISAAEDPSLEITQAIYDDAGQPWIGAGFSPDGGVGAATWWICQPGAACVQAPSADGWLKPGPVAAGTTFEARATVQGLAYLARSPVWNGRLSPTSHPTLTGRPIVGQKVRPVGAHWTGGWAQPGDYSKLHVEACRTAKAGRCVTLSAQGEDYPRSGARPILASRYLGWYLFAIDARYSRDSAFAGVGYRDASAVPPVKVGPTIVRSRAYGPIRRR